MKVKLGNVPVEARSNGGLNFYPYYGEKRNYPMLIVEVFTFLWDQTLI